MTNLTPSMRLKVKGDTFFFPDPNSGVYFRNNLSSFRMEGSMIDKWVEKLIPMFNGEYTLANLTDGLPGPYRDRVYEIAEVLYQNGFVRDVSQDRPHQLANQILKKHASQIEFLDSFGDSGAYRFQAYRQAKVLAVGSGSFFVSLVSALLESGLPKFHVLITDSVKTNTRRLMELVAHARKTDPEVAVEEVILQEKSGSSWKETVQAYQSILYVSQNGDIEELRDLHRICREEKKVFIPAVCLEQVGLAGPLVHPDSIACWESAWRRIHQSVFFRDQQLTAFSSTAGAMLANVIVFELFKDSTKERESEQNNQIFMLNLNTLEGSWHSFVPHPLVDSGVSAEWVQDIDLRLERSINKDESSKLLFFFSQLASAQSGIFHIWEEGDLKQLPLAQCRVQAVDLLTEGPAGLLPEMICTGLTHEEALKEAGLSGIEAYISQTTNLLITSLPPHKGVETSLADKKKFIGFGAGETFAEGVGRGLQRCLEMELNKQLAHQKNYVSRVSISEIGDDRCRYYFQALTTMRGEPIIGLGEEVAGFPVVWIGTNGSWYGSVGLNITGALRNVLQHVLMIVQNESASHSTKVFEVPSVRLEEREHQSLVIHECEVQTEPALLRSAIKTLERNHKQLLVFEAGLEPFLKMGLEGIYGVMIREVESQ
ncbi:putative thiazole-containing bacteriocin maturation protein [Bacillus sp. DTU_2020_1000418_1_SI_GHA_SEK_038]|uniref:putative thiazole-containing bacteriocin maturation protein n=1 Tax=Bacillus sp. DTU_2020_1000418_1_SI_GHA_SEK_038 TaxID=3077585 RepID=UPI0028E1E5B9|nr:putative thiazole-containing bacteriocin maturation protein [Bacillus sp. DTU_2020_1000418_1_SI_GHA_SEK_038]WNS73736.1 putative thiazole-containing bacteriocin maturation protein [Bacillus sp. DTU_2020_1000418_1_SI_GHA_SEK_038]